MYGMNMPYGYPMMGTNPNPTPTPPIMQNSNMDWIRVNTMADVQNVSVQPGQKAWIMLASDPIFVLKTADNMGITTSEAYRFEKIDNARSTPQYVTREEFDEFVKSITANPKAATRKAESNNG